MSFAATGANSAASPTVRALAPWQRGLQVPVGPRQRRVGGDILAEVCPEGLEAPPLRLDTDRFNRGVGVDANPVPAGR